MKKKGLAGRLLALLLVLSMVLPMVPLGAFAAVGDESDAGMSLPTNGTGVSNTDTVSWPVKIYDYLNDGVLFEYAQANDLTATTNLYYGGGMPMPFQDSTMVGNDYTINTTYSENAWTYYVDGNAAEPEVEVSVVAAEDDTAPMYAHFKYVQSDSATADPAKDEGTKFRAWISDFATDNDTYYDKDDIRYIAIVYRTNEVMDAATIDFCFETNSSTDERYRGPTKALPASPNEWSYFIYDMNETGTVVPHRTGSAADYPAVSWSSIGEDNIDFVSFTFPLNGIINGVAEEMDISHIAYFGSEAEATAFGEKALVFHDDPGVYLAGNGAAMPSAGDGYVYDYTTSEAYDSVLYGSTQALGNNSWIGSTQIAASNGTPMYLHVSEGSDDLDTAYIANFTSDFGGEKAKADARYVTIVYRSSGITTGERSYGFWVESSNYYPYAAGKGSRSYSYMNSFTPSSDWTYLTYDLNSIADYDSDYSSLATFSKVGWYLPGLYSDETLDVSHIGFFGSQSEADAFGKAAVAYDKNPGSIKTWNMGNNAAFGMLYSSAGGAWGHSTGIGGEGDVTTNGYFSYPIGLLQQPCVWSDTVASSMIANHKTGVGDEENQIYLLYPEYESDLDMSTLDFDGYSLFGTAVQTTTWQTLFTAGLIEPTLQTVTNPDGTTDKVIAYREETVDYIAKLLSYTLVIPRFDADGNPNYNFVRGTAHAQFGTVNGEPIDLATALRNCLGITFTEGQDTGSAPTMGTYAETVAKKDNLIGAFADCKAYITTCYDAAYYILNNLFVSNSYNEEQDDYVYLQLNKVEGTEGTYVFDGGFTKSDETSAIDYGSDSILNTVDATGKMQFVYEGNQETTLYPFLPVTDVNNNSTYPDITWTPYFADDGVSSVTVGKDSYMDRNFNYVMATNGEFHYYADDELFFQFEGDDDVYLFLNGQLVLDIGGGHSIARVEFNVDDYVNWAWGIKNDSTQYNALSLEEKARVDAFALNDGDVCTFDFYYMERHGYGANCRIMTNIRVTDPSMDVVKSAYQDGVEVSEGGIINKENPVEYGFAMTNKGDAPLYQLTFKDEDIGLELNPTDGLKITNTTSGTVTDVNGEALTASDLYAVVTHPGYDTITVQFADNEALKAFLKDCTADGLQSGQGLFVGATVLIRGFAYNLTDADKEAGKFFNTVKAEANSQPDGTGTPLISEDDMRVFIAAEPMYYQWASADNKEHVLNVTVDKLVADILAAAKDPSNSLYNEVTDITGVTSVVEVNAKGSARDYPYVTVNGTESIDIYYPTPGSYVFYLKITHSGGSLTVPVLVNVADVVDSIFVLDYGLNAVLTEGNELHKEDTLTVPARETAFNLLGIAESLNSNTPTYDSNTISFNRVDSNTIGDEAIKTDDGGEGSYDGIFTLSGNTLSYKPTDFMDQRDKIWLALSVHESGVAASAIGSTDINNEVQMFKSVTVLPANVVYYEDDFPAITYYSVESDGTTTGENGEVVKLENTFMSVSGSSTDLNQDVDQSQEYGQDSQYQNNSDMSGNSLHTITIRDAENFASFKFTGTGFELLSRTCATAPSAIAVTVVNSAEEQVRVIPVITEFDNGSDGGEELIYQVPVIRVDDLDWGTYTVYINGMPTYDFDHPNEDGTYPVNDSYFYLDGLRIFEPLAEEQADGTMNPGKAEEYLNTENDVTFLEIRDQIMEGKVASATYDATNGLTVSSALTTWTENLNGTTYEGATFTGNQVDSIEDYLIKGPNNEVYMNGDLSYTALIFYVQETGTGVHNLQIAVHAVDQSLFNGSGSTGMNARVQYGIKTDTKYDWEDLVTVTSGTEQYYTIPYTACPYVEGKGYQVAITVASGMASFTSLKVNGLELQTISGGDSTSLQYVDGVLTDTASNTAVDMALYMDYETVGYQMRRTTFAVEEEPEETTTPETSEPTVPETTEPETSEPTVPETTEPETTEPTTPETEPDHGASGSDNLDTLWKILMGTINLLKQLLGRA